MKKHLLNKVVTIFILCCFSACATTPENPDEAGYPQESRRNDCISELSIRDYQVLDDANLIIRGSGKRTFHLVLARRAFGLGSSMSLGFQSRSGQICSGFSSVVFEEFGRLERVPIRSMRRLNPEEHDELLVRFGKKEPEVKQASEAEDVEGAEVEELD
jgi:hypothetical protein